MDISQIIKTNHPDAIDVANWADERYSKDFAPHFVKMREAYNHMKAEIRVITDSELEWALTELPMEMFTVAEKLNNLRLQLEVIKLENKKAAQNKTASVDDAIVAKALESLITRVENELSYSKEFIMGCKKVWDSRRRSEASNPIAPVIPDYNPDAEVHTNQPIHLPDYGTGNPKTYIK